MRIQSEPGEAYKWVTGVDNEPAVAANPDGSWGDVEAEDIYRGYHPTWAAIDGLRDYAWRGEGLSFRKLKPLLEQWAKTKG